MARVLFLRAGDIVHPVLRKAGVWLTWLGVALGEPTGSFFHHM